MMWVLIGVAGLIGFALGYVLALYLVLADGSRRGIEE